MGMIIVKQPIALFISIAMASLNQNRVRRVVRGSG